MTSAAAPPASASIDPPAPAFPPEFVWGAATSSFQIEGAADADGKSPSIWDRFCTLPGRIADGSDGRTACDHFHRSREDVELMVDLGLDAYRFSLSWPRIVPDGRGEENPAGLDFYDRLVDQLLDAGITPFPTLYHWDLPQALENAGGWPERSTVDAFTEYVASVVRRLGDRIDHWTTINEPFVISHLGYLTGEHAPGRRDLRAAIAASHHVLLAHGRALETIRELAPRSEVGITVNFTPVTPVGDSPLASDRQRVIDEWENRWYTDPLSGRGYPDHATERLGWDRAEVLDGDLDLIAAPIDFLGVNYYTRKFVGALDGEHRNRGDETAMGWEIHPPGLGNLLRDLHRSYGFPKLYITENGAAMPDAVRHENGHLQDDDRIAYFHDHLEQTHAALTDGVPIAGYFAWSLLDNFEWAHGYGAKFGLVEVDPTTQDRRPKASAHWYAQVIRTRSLPTAGPHPTG